MKKLRQIMPKQKKGQKAKDCLNLKLVKAR